MSLAIGASYDKLASLTIAALPDKFTPRNPKLVTRNP